MKRSIKTVLCTLLLLLSAVFLPTVPQASAAETEELYIETEYGQTEARAMLDLINAFRTDKTGEAWYWNSDDTTKTVFNTEGNVTLGELKYDYELEKAAMQRAAEISVSFSHTRPNGSSCFTAFPSSGYTYMGENIAAGNADMEDTFEQWREENDPYSGQGHRRNMLNPDFNAIGIGHVYVNGYHFWVQELGRTTNTTTKTTANDSAVITIVGVDGSRLTLLETDLSGAEEYSLKVGESTEAPEVVRYYNFAEHWPSYMKIISSAPTSWKSSNESVACVKDGKIVAADVGNAVLTAEGTDITVSVNVKGRLTITQQPKNVTVVEGDKAVVEMKVEGEGLSYEWWYANAGSSTFSKSSVKSAVYPVEVDKTRDGRRVYCVITDKYGSKVTTDTVTVNISKSMIITKKPVSVWVKDGEKAVVEVQVQGEGLTYQWWYANAGSSTFSKSSLTGNIYSIYMDSTRSGRRVYCVITDKYGTTHKTDEVRISMLPAITITEKPVDAAAYDGEKAVVKVQAEGEGLTYQWWYANAGSSTFSKSSLTGNVYSVYMDSSRSGRKVYCVITDKYGNTLKTDTVELTIKTPLKIIQQPKSVTVTEGDKAVVEMKVQGDGLRFQWWYANAGSSTFSKSSLIGGVYSVYVDKTRDGRRVYCVITDKYGNTLKTDTITVGISKSLVITKQPVGVSVKNGQKAVVEVQAQGEGLTYQWWYANAGSSTYSKSSLTGNVYSVYMDSTRSGRRVYCVITDKYGTTHKTDEVRISMLPAITITGKPVDAAAYDGEKAVVKVQVEGEGLTYQWWYANAGSSTFSKSSLTGNVYSVYMDSSRSGRKVYCVITDKYGNTLKTDTVELTMKTPLKIIQQPKNVTVAEGEKAVVEMKIQGDGLRFQWWYANAGSSTFSKSSLIGGVYSVYVDKTRDGRMVYCVITDKYGNTLKTDTVTVNIA